MEIRKLILTIIKLRMEIQHMHNMTIGRLDNNLEPIFGSINDEDKKLINLYAKKMLEDYENDNELYLIINNKLPPDAYKEYMENLN